MSAAHVAESPSVPTSPYKGLAPFQDSKQDALLFFGREREREVIVANLVAAPLTILFGPSGVGKSSILRAAVARSLRELPGSPLVVVHDAWSDDPAAAIAHAIGGSAGAEPASLVDTVDAVAARHEELYLVLDQLEEYFVYHGASPALGEALAELTSPTSVPVHVLLGIREDVLAQLDAFKSHVPGLLANRLRLDHLTRDGARRAIVGPLERFGELVGEEERPAAEPALVEAVLDGVRTGAVVQAGRGRGVASEPDDSSRIEAPYLQVVMQRLWEEERAAGSRILRLATLDELGGPERIVRTHLERALAVLTTEQKRLAARVFNHLVTPSGTKIAHTTDDLVKWASAAEADVLPVLATLSHRRILRPVGGNGSGAHEIYHDVLADAVLAWRDRFDAQEALERAEADARRRHRRLLVVVAASLAALAVTTTVAIFALTQRSEARDEARHARARELEAAALTDLTVDPARSLASALEAARLEPDRGAEVVLRKALLDSRLRGVLESDGPVTSAFYSPDGAAVLTASEDGSARIFDAHTYELRRRFDAGASLAGAVYDPAGRVVVTAGADGLARVWDADSGRRVAALRHGDAVRGAAFSRGGKLLVTASADGTARIWDTRTWRLRTTLPHSRAVRDAEFDGDGGRVVTRTNDRFARLFDARTGRLVRTFDQRGALTVAAFSGNGRYVLTAGRDGTAKIWDAATGQPIAVLPHGGHVLDAAIAQGIGLAATASAGSAVRVWTFPRGELVNVLHGHTNSVLDVAFSRDGSLLVSAGRDHTARLWRPYAGNVRALMAGSTDRVTHAEFSPDGRSVVTSSDDGTARIWDASSEPRLSLLVRSFAPLSSVDYGTDGSVLVGGPGRRVSLRNGGSGRALSERRAADVVTSTAFAPDGVSAVYGAGREVAVVTVPELQIARRLRAPCRVLSVSAALDGSIAAGCQDGAVVVWDPSGRPLRTLPERGAERAYVSFSPDGSRLVAGTSDGKARAWNVATGALERTLAGHRDARTSARYSSDGSAIATASIDHDVRIWDVASGHGRVFAGHYGRVNDARFSPDGRWIVTAGPGGGGLWDVQSGELFSFLRGHHGQLTSAAFDAASRRIVTAGRDGTVRTYVCDICADVEGLVLLAEGRLGLE